MKPLRRMPAHFCHLLFQSQLPCSATTFLQDTRLYALITSVPKKIRTKSIGVCITTELCPNLFKTTLVDFFLLNPTEFQVQLQKRFDSIYGLSHAPTLRRTEGVNRLSFLLIYLKMRQPTIQTLSGVVYHMGKVIPWFAVVLCSAKVLVYKSCGELLFILCVGILIIYSSD